MDDETAAWPLSKEDPMSAGMLQFISVLTSEASDPMGTGATAQPQQKKGNDTATEAAIDQQLSDMAQSLQSKVLQFGEAEFWSHWFNRYKKHGPDLGEKMANIVGVKGVKTEMIKLSDFKTDFPPGVLVYSAKEADYKELVLRRDLINLYPQLQQSLGIEGMRNFNKHVFFPKFLQDPSLIDTMLPDTLDEIKAKGENELLSQDKYPQVSPTDNHETHIYIHQMVQPKTLATWFHIAEHEDYLAKQKGAIMAQQAQQNQQSQPTNKTQTSNASAAAPLQQEMQTSQQPQAWTSTHQMLRSVSQED